MRGSAVNAVVRPTGGVPAEDSRSGRASVPHIFLCAYGLTIFSMAVVGVLAPLVGRLSSVMGVPVAEVGVAIALYSLPSALFSGIVGSLADRWGARLMLAWSGLSAGIDALYLFKASSLIELKIGLLGAGVSFCGIVTSAPALIIERLDGSSRARLLSLWATYGPGGFAVGLLLSARFAGGPNWRFGLIFCGLFLIAGSTLAFLVPRNGQVKSAAKPVQRARVIDLLLPVRSVAVVRLALAIALPTGISYGTSLLMPSYLAQSYGVTIATASGGVALAKLLIVVSGGLLSGWLISRSISSRALFAALAVVGLGAQILLYWPASGIVFAITGLAIWFFTYAAMAGVGMALVPTLVADPRHSGAASGVVSQFISCASFLGSILYFSGVGWLALIAIAAVGLAASAVMLPQTLKRPGLSGGGLV